MPATIASVYWDVLEAKRTFREPNKGGFLTTYRLDAVPKLGDPPSTRIVYPAQELVFRGEGSYLPMLVLPEPEKVFSTDDSERDVSARHIAEDVVKELRRGAPGTPGKGVWVCAGPSPTRAEIEESTHRQVTWARLVVARCTRNWIRHRTPPLPLPREAAAWLGERPEWLEMSATGALIHCPFCATLTPRIAPVCQHCDRVHDPVRMRELEAGVANVDQEIAALEAEMPEMGEVKDILGGEEDEQPKTRDEVLRSGRGVKDFVKQRLDERQKEKAQEPQVVA